MFARGRFARANRVLEAFGEAEDVLLTDKAWTSLDELDGVGAETLKLSRAVGDGFAGGVTTGPVKSPVIGTEFTPPALVP